jgi:subfamily B ATP-binding cassette protein MsbA
MLRNAPIFIFDEATSQVDVDSERKIREAMTTFMKDRTSLVIAHRIATIVQADRIVVMDRGRIVDVGDHESLLARCDLYKTLYYTHLHGHSESAAVAEQPAG